MSGLRKAAGRCQIGLSQMKKATIRGQVTIMKF